MENSSENTPIDAQHLCRLARLALTSSESQGLQNDLRRIISMIDAMASVDTEAVTPLANPLEATSRMRQDEVTEIVELEAFQALAPEAVDGLYLVPRVVE